MRPPLEAGRWARLETLFYAAVDMDPAQRYAFLDERCGDDVTLRRDVESLLESSQKTLDFLHKPIRQLTESLVQQTEHAGERIGTYQLLKPLGEGGMGRVYLASRADELYRQEVAVKVLQPGSKPTASMLLRFSAERQILANLNHPNISRLLDGGITTDGSPYLVMEYVDGVPIDECCRENGLALNQRLKLFCTVCAAVAYAHKNLVVHRDIKPANILVTREGVPKLLDFGIAKLLDHESQAPTLTRTAERVLTPEYASPEQIRGDSVTTSTDVYGLGVLLYELLAGSRPFQLQTQSPLEAMRIICEESPDPPSKRIAADSGSSNSKLSLRVHEELDHIVLMAIRKEPERRYVSVAALARDVEAYLEGYPVQARSDTWSYRGGKFVLRHKIAVVAAAAAFLALVVFSIGMGWLAKRASRARVAAEQQQLTAEREAQFLASIFSAATPEQAKGQEVTARQLLDQGARRVDSELASEPEVQATMLDNLGHAYDRLGLYEQARPLLERAYEFRKHNLSAGSLDLAQSAQDLGNIYRLEAKYEKAEPLFRQALAIREKTPGEHGELLSDSLNSLGECLFLENRDAESEATLRRALALEGNRENVLAAVTRDYLARVVGRKGNFNEEVRLLEDAVRIDRQTEGAESPDFAISLHNLASAQMDLGDLLGGERTEREALKIRRRISGNDHPELAYPLNNLGWVLLAKGEWREAEPLLAEALAIRRKALGEKHPLTAASLNNWARVLEAKGDYAGAEKVFMQALGLIRASSGPQSWATAKILSNLGLLQLDQGDYAAAEGYARQALEMRIALGGDDNNNDVAASLIEVGVAREYQNDPASAEQLFRQVLGSRRKKFPAWHPDLLAAEIRLGEALLTEGRLSQAEPLLRDAVSGAHSAPFPLLPWQVAEAEVTYGVCLARLGRSAESKAALSSGVPALNTYPEAAMHRQIERLVHSVSQPPRT